ncbi:uncharacterized protein LOC116112415 isoform X2 [Pistacia vera]|uniref:uncharacterized protein LOC116112415 isoform X2 n=1 Tax=Pistacia vera TaxID=55513 RepID=UPI0012631DD7|nr:uncharacterized protein LOC116112415 isoform X2 [Pistacia vera]
MANPGVGTKFLSVNLNKSYGQSHHQHQNNLHNLSHSGHHGSNRGRPGGGAGGGGMVVLSRPRSSQKAAGPKLSVPPPLNLPSLRKEHERFDSLGSSGVSAGGGVSGGGQRPGSSGMGWTKPGTQVALQEKGGVVSGDRMTDDGVDQGLHGVDGVSKGSGGGGAYMPPSVRSGPVRPPSSTFPHVEKVSVLRGEDFPSLRAALPSLSGSEKKHRDGLNQKQKHAMGEEYGNSDRSDSSRLNSLVDLHPRSQSGGFGNGLSENGGRNRDLGGSRGSEQVRKQDEYFPGPLPLVRLNPRSDWADDERDTGHGFAVRDRDHGFSKSEAYWDRDFDMPRPSVLPHKPAHNVFDRWAQRDNETGKVSSSEVTKVDPFGRDARTPSREGREGNLWRASSPLQKDGFGAQEIGNDRNSFGARPYSQNREANKENKFVSSSFRDIPPDDFGKRDLGYGQAGRQPRNNMGNSPYRQRAERNPWERYGNEQYNRFRGDVSQNNSASKSSFSSGGRGLPVNDPILNFGRDKRPVMKSEKPYLEDPFMKDFGASGFDVRDPFSGGLVGVVKKKKDLKQTDFHDPVRESFEAELERVQKMQEQERLQIIEEHERALELARREEEERLRVAREQEEHRRRLEEEAREAAWRAEQERLDAMRKAEEQRIAREEEKQRIVMEEERRKQAAKQKLLELEERMAKRQVVAIKGGSNSSIVAEEKFSGMPKERDISKVTDLAEWEDGEGMVERITTSASSDSSGLNRAFDMNCRPHFARDNSPAIMERGKPINSWRRDAFENGNSSAFFPQDSDNAHYSPRRDATVGGKTFPRKEYFGGPGFMSSRTYYKAGIQEPRTDEINHPRGQRWNISGDGDHYARNAEVESDFHENQSERYSDVGWGHSRYRGNPYPSYPERLYQNPETDGLSSFGRSRYSMRHPRVLPPPSLSAMQKTSYRRENERPGPSTFQENEMEYNHAARSETTGKIGFDSSNQHNLVQPEIIDVQQDNAASLEQNLDTDTTPRCDSQSSLSVSSPPDSPVHLSHDDLDESGDSLALSADEDKDISSGQGNDPVVLPMESEKENMMTHSSSVSVGDDEEWTVENDERLQEQEEYDEDEDGYEEEDEIHEGDDENINLTEEFEDMHLVEKSSPDMVNNLVLGFNEGVEVAMPNDEFERSPLNEESSFPVPQVSVGTVVEDQGCFDGVCGTLQSANVPSQATTGGSSRIFQEAENAMHDLVIQPSSTQLSAASELLVHADANSGSVVSNQQPIPSSIDMTSHSSSDQTVTSATSAGPSQAEAPVKLQFGLFSGPSLIPSPIPAIQIGSIQMPLLHPQVGPSLAHMHPSQSPLFQFGQLRYSSPISQGVLPLAAQSVPIVQSNISANFSLNQNAAVSQPIQPSPEISQNLMKSDASSLSMDNQLGLAQRHLDLSEGNALNEVTSLPASESAVTTFMAQQGRAEVFPLGDKKTRSDSGLQVEDQGHHISVMRNFKSLSKESENLLQARAASSVSSSKEKTLNVSKAQGLISGGRSKRYVVSVRNNSGSKSSFVAPETSRSDSGGFQRRPRRQRTEFRVRENIDKRLSAGVVSANQITLDDKSNINGRGTGFSNRSGYRRVVVSNKSMKQMNESESLDLGVISSREIDSGSKAGKGVGRESLTKSQNIPHPEEGNLKRTFRSKEDVDTPLQSGVVRVFEQPGIEAPSDEDDFIEVRSKRQMLNDRREQREKEIKAKSRFTKMPRKSRSTSQNSLVSASSNKFSASMSEAANDVRSDFVATDGRNSAHMEVSTGFGASKVSQPLAPIGTPALKTDVQADKRPQTIKSLQKSPVPVLSGGEKNLASGFIFDSKNKVLDNVQTPMGSWGNSRLNQQVMALTQNQLDEAMNPGQFDSRVSSKDHTSSVGEPSMPSSAILTKDKSFSSTASPINSLLAGEKIQFGAVTSPTVLPPSTRAVSHGIGPPGPCRSEIQIAHNISAAKSDCTLFFDKEKHSNETCVNLEDCEAEAAASAIAVAAISSDEIIGNGLGTCSASVSETKSFGGAEIDGITAGDQQSVSQSRAEESLTVALPADLSVETPPISLWPPLPSPPNSSSQMISHFPGGPASHFPFYEMNPMLGGPIFTFGPHDESVPAQSQTQKSSIPSSTPLGTWQQCHSGVDSFYGAPTGYAGPFISPTGGIPGVQGPPHMVFYNHFAPVGQFGQVGLSFMGATYIPSAKQPDWKRHPVSSAMGVGEGEVNDLNMVAAQRNPTSLTAPIQHLAPGSPLMPMASTLAMFDVSPFQSSSDMSVQGQWSNVTAAPHQPVSISMPLQQQPDGVLPPQYNHGPPVDQSSANRFSESRTSTPSESSRNYHAASDVTVTQLPDELGLVDSSNTTGPGTSTQNVVAKSLSLSTITDAGKIDVVQNSGSSSSSESVGQNNIATFKPQSSQQKNTSSQQYSNSSGYSYQRGSGISQKNSSGGEWSHRRMGFHGRNQPFSAEKGFAPSKMKQIYVAKQTTSGTSAPS